MRPEDEAKVVYNKTIWINTQPRDRRYGVHFGVLRNFYEETAGAKGHGGLIYHSSGVGENVREVGGCAKTSPWEHSTEKGRQNYPLLTAGIRTHIHDRNGDTGSPGRHFVSQGEATAPGLELGEEWPVVLEVPSGSRATRSALKLYAKGHITFQKGQCLLTNQSLPKGGVLINHHAMERYLPEF
ncbi:hypothetical protein P691DRAFT_786943 [Macrolepiota fuliginosa MF-IS2]|uniref:Uncharacterized protein n=1 Tax=Macrolepiota fuliginosa MF-IS2 TaxID=1400762 RepID=A0A9P6C751_9AGAR|nr:hypothetical protein P691DRAFT_786943 [Macrolepiota fuliginosa MF-IS2]